MAKLDWISLQPGDIVDVIAPGMKPAPEAIKGIDRFLSRWGLQARYPKDLVTKDLICSSSRLVRQKHLIQALTAKDSKMVWCLRGGYGSLHLIPFLKKIKAAPCKIFLGLSDITTLHLFLNQQWGWSTIHGCNLDRFAIGQSSKSEEQRLRRLLFGRDAQVSFQLKPLNDPAKNARNIQSSLIGGNLINLQASFGTDFQLKTKGKILFVEEIGERPYKVDRVFEQMGQMGLLASASAVVFGQFTGGKEPDGRNLLPRWMKEFAQEQKIPVYNGISSGHGPNQHPVPLNTMAQLQRESDKFILSVQSGGQF